MDQANSSYRSGGVPGTIAVETIAKLRDTGHLEQGLGVGGMIAGGLGLATAVVLLKVDPTAPAPEQGASLSVGLSQGGATVQVGGRF